MDTRSCRGAAALLLCLIFPDSFLHAQTSEDILWVKGGHEYVVVAVAQSADGRYVASAEYGGRTVVWERNSGNQLRIIPHATDDWGAIAFLRDNRTLAGKSGSDIFFYDALSGRQTGKTALPDTAVTAVFPLRDTTLLVVHATGAVHVVDPLSGGIAASFRLPDNAVYTPRLVDKGSFLLYVNARDSLKVWDMKKGELLAHGWYLSYDDRFAGASDTTLVAVTSDDIMKIYDVERGDVVPGRVSRGTWWGSLALSPTGDTAAIEVDEELRFLLDTRSGVVFGDLPFGRVLEFIRGIPERSHAESRLGLLEFSPAGDALLLRTYSQRYFSYEHGFQLYRIRTRDSISYLAHTHSVDAIAVRPGDSTIVDANGSVRAIATGALLALNDYGGFSRDGLTLISTSIESERGMSGIVRIHTVGGRSWTAWDHYHQLPWPYAVAPGGRYALLKGELYFADSTYYQRKKFDPSATRARFAWDGDHFAVWSEGHIAIRDCRTTTIVREIATEGRPSVVEFSKDNSRIAVGYADGHIDLYETFSGTYLLRLEGHTGWVTDLSFTRRDRFLASTAIDGTLRTWNLETGVNDYTYTWPAQLFSVSTSSDGQYILTGGEDLTAICWRGRGEISNTEELLDRKMNEPAASVYPNPIAGSEGGILVDVPIAGHMEIEIVRSDGRIVFGESRGVPAGRHRFPLAASSLNSGGYYCLLRLTGMDGSVVRFRPVPFSVLR